MGECVEVSRRPSKNSLFLLGLASTWAGVGLSDGVMMAFGVKVGLNLQRKSSPQVFMIFEHIAPALSVPFVFVGICCCMFQTGALTVPLVQP